MVEGCVDVFKCHVTETEVQGRLSLVGWMEEESRTDLRPITLRPTMAARPLHTAKSSERRSGSRCRRSETTKRTTAITSCVQRKNRGASVEFRTHLLLEYGISAELLAHRAWRLHHDHLGVSILVISIRKTLKHNHTTNRESCHEIEDHDARLMGAITL